MGQLSSGRAKMLLSVFICVLFFGFFCLEGANALNPVVLVPGLGGSQIEAKLNRKTTEHYICSKHSDWYTIWLSVIQLEIGQCMVDNLKLNINETDGTTSNQEGVETRQPGFGNTETVEWLDPFHPIGKSYFEYFVNIVERLKTDLHYERNKSIRGAPYDFRKAPNEMSDYLKNLTDLIRETYEMNNNSKVVIIGHSMGNNVALYMLNNQPSWWRKKYIAAFISIAAPWAGSVKTLRLIASGDSLGMSSHLINPLQARPLQQSMPSNAWLMPYKPYWKGDEVLLMGPKRNYTVNDYDEFMMDVNFKSGIVLRKKTERLIKNLKEPDVKVFCLYGINKEKDTPAFFDYRKSSTNPWYDEQPDTTNGTGDGTVNQRSLEVCKSWKHATVKEFENAEHLSILSDQRLNDYIVNILVSLRNN